MTSVSPSARAEGKQPVSPLSSPRNRDASEATPSPARPPLNTQDVLAIPILGPDPDAVSCWQGVVQCLQDCTCGIWYVITAPFVFIGSCIYNCFAWFGSLCGFGNAAANPLHVACETGDEDALRRLIEAGVDLNQVDEQGWPPLHQLFRLGHHQLIPLLIEAGADVNAQNRLGNTLLHMLCTFENQAIRVNVNAAAGLMSKSLIDVVVEAGANLDIADNEGNTPLHIAGKTHARSAAGHLWGATPPTVDARNRRQETPLHLACKAGAESMVQFLADKIRQADVNARDVDGRTPLHCYCVISALQARAESKAAKAIRADRAAKAAKAKKPGEGLAVVTGLHKTIGTDKKAFLLQALAAGRKFDVNAKDNNGMTPLQLASARGRLKTVEMLVQLLNADVDVADKKGRTAFHHAAMNGKIEVLRYLAGRVVNVDTVDRERRTAFFLLWLNPEQLNPAVRQVTGQVLVNELGADPKIAGRKNGGLAGELELPNLSFLTERAEPRGQAPAAAVDGTRQITPPRPAVIDASFHEQRLANEFGGGDDDDEPFSPVEPDSP